MFRVTAFVLLLSCSLLAVAADADKPAAAPATASATASKSQPPAKPAVSLDDIRMFTAVFDLVKQAYVEPVDDKTLMQAAVRGLLSAQEPNCEYIDDRANGDLSGVTL
jgi:carboxyl-terminal processing protease